MTVNFFVALLALIGYTKALPTPRTEFYQQGVTHSYQYDFSAIFNEDYNVSSQSAIVGRNVGFEVKSLVKITNIWQNSNDNKELLLKLELLSPLLRVSSAHYPEKGFVKHTSHLDDLSSSFIYVHWNDFTIKNVFVTKEEKILTNLKKGVASLLQFKVTEGNYKEADVSGYCKVYYTVNKESIRKLKRNCTEPKEKMAPNPSQIRSETTRVRSETNYNFIPSSNVIKQAIGKETVQLKLTIWKQAASFVKSMHTLRMIDNNESESVVKASSVEMAISEISKEKRIRLYKEDLFTEAENSECKGDQCKSLHTVVNEHLEHLMPENIAKTKSALGYLRLLEKFRNASKKEILDIITITHNKKIRPQIYDILAATQTESSIEAVFETLDLKKDHNLAERFFICLSVIPHPSQFLITKLIKLMQQKFENEKMKATVINTLAALTKSYCQSYPDKLQSQEVNHVKEILVQGIKSCDSDSCITIYLNGLINAALPNTIEDLLSFIKKGGKPGVLALKALNIIAAGQNYYLSNQALLALQHVYWQFWPRQDSSARIIAAELLIKAMPTDKMISDIMGSLDDRESSEVTTVVLAKLVDLASSNSSIRSCLSKTLKNTTYGNYNFLAQNGSSTSFTKFLANGNDSNLKYTIDMEMKTGGMLKRTSMNIQLENDNDKLDLLNLGLFVNGFGKTAQEKENEVEQEEQSAGMELSVLGVKLRPYIFFTGTTELMGLVWSSAGSELTPALQSNLLLMDNTKTVTLQSGINISLKLRGVLSVDVSGTSEVSVWNKNSHSLVKNSVAMVIHGSVSMDTMFAKSHVQFSVGGNAHVDIITDLDYSVKPMRVCIQMDQPDYTFRHNVRKSEIVPGSQYLIRTLKKRTLYYPGKSYALHRRNFVSCRELLEPKKSSYW